MYLIVTSSEKIAGLAKDEGAQILALKPEQFFTEPLSFESNSVQTDVTDLLLSLGIRPHIKGFHYIKYVLENQFKPNAAMTKVIYPSVAKHFNTTPTRVERAIRHAIHRSFESKASSQKYMNIFGNTTFAPSNSEFFATVKLYLNKND